MDKGKDLACGGREKGLAECQKRLGRIVALIMLAIGTLAVAVGLTGCVDDDDGPQTDWYISGVWQNNSYPDEQMVFYSDGTGYWYSISDGSSLDFDYYCYADMIYFTFYPPYEPSYDVACYIDFMSSSALSITWPGDSWYGPAQIFYTRLR